MLKKLLIASLLIVTTAFSAPLSKWLAGDDKARLLSWRQLAVSAVCFLVFTAFVALLESARAIDLNWWWHRFWLFREVVEGERSNRPRKIFGQADAAENISVTEVEADGVRKNLAELLLGRLKGEAGVGRILVVGEPGSGKTVTLERLRSRLARRGAKRFGAGTPIPVLVRMGGYGKGKILDYVKEVMGRQSKTAAKLSQGLEKLFERGRVVLLLDALDEALGQNPDAAKEVEDLLSNYRYARARVVVSGRRGEYEKRLPADMEILEVQDLSDEAVLSLIRLNHTKDDKPPAAAAVMSALAAEGLLKPGGLGRNPFWLGLILQGGTFENNKAKIFDSAMSALLEREWDKEGSQRLWKRVLTAQEQLEETREGLTRLAYQISVGHKTEEIDRDEAVKIINDYLSTRIGIAGLRPQDVLWLGRDAQLVDFNPSADKKGGRPVRFRHRLIREYLTACRLSKDAKLALRAIDRHSPNVRWWDTLLMLGALRRDAILTDEHRAFVKAAAGDGTDPRRLMLASAMLESNRLFEGRLRTEVLDPLADDLVKGVREAHVEAAVALADIAPGRLVDLLRDLAARPGAGLKPAVEDILRKLLQDESGAERRSNLVAALLKDHELRDIALPVLVSVGGPSVAPLIGVLGDAGMMARWHAAEALGQIKDKRAVEPLIKLLDDPDDTVRRTAVAALGKIGDVRALAPIARVFNPREDKSAKDFLINAEVLRALGGLGEPAIDELIRMLKLDEVTAWVFAGISLTQIGKPAVRPLVEALGQNSGSAFFRSRVVDILGNIGDEEAAEPLLKLLRADDIFLSGSVAGALAKLGDPAVGPLISLLGDKQVAVRTRAARVLGDMKSRRAVEPLIALLASRSPDERRNREEAAARAEAAEALGDIGDVRALDALNDAVENDVLSVGISAAASLAKLGDGEALKILHNLLTDYKDTSSPSATASVHYLVAQDLGELKRSESLVYLEKFLSLHSDAEVGDKKARERFAEARREANLAIGNITRHMLGKPADSDSDGDEPERDIRLYGELLAHQNESFRATAVTALTAAGRPGVDLLIEVLNSDDSGVRKYAAIGLGVTKSERAVEPLIKTFQTDEDSVVRKLAAEALGEIGDPRAREALRPGLEEDSLVVKIGAATALGQLGEAGMVDYLHALSSGKDIPAMSFVIAWAYQKIGDPAALPFLEELLANADGSEQLGGFKLRDVIDGAMKRLQPGAVTTTNQAN